MLTPSLGATIPVLKSWFAWGNLDSLRRSEASSASPLGISISSEYSTGKQTVAERQRGRFAGSSRGQNEISGKVAPEAREGLKGTGGDAGFAEATQALDNEWRSRQRIGAVNQVIE